MITIRENDGIRTRLMSPQEAHALIRKTKTRIYLHTEVNGITEWNKKDDSYRAFEVPKSVRITKREAVNLMKEMIGFADRKKEAGEDKPIQIKIADCDNCLFIN